MIWVPLGVLIGGVVLAAIVFGFTGYEISWKARRLRDDLAKLEALNTRVGELQAQIARASQAVQASEFASASGAEL